VSKNNKRIQSWWPEPSDPPAKFIYVEQDRKSTTSPLRDGGSRTEINANKPVELSDPSNKNYWLAKFDTLEARFEALNAHYAFLYSQSSSRIKSLETTVERLRTKVADLTEDNIRVERDLYDVRNQIREAENATTALDLQVDEYQSSANDRLQSRSLDILELADRLQNTTAAV